MSDHPVVIGKRALLIRIRQIEAIGDRTRGGGPGGAAVHHGDVVVLEVVVPHELHEALHVRHLAVIPVEDPAPGRLVVGEPIAELLNLLVGARQLEDLRIEGAVVGLPVALRSQEVSLILDDDLAGELFENGQDSILEIMGTLRQPVVVNNHPLVVVGAAENNQIKSEVTKKS